jgi:U3 small nucleolar RNA-associated protein 7
MHSLCIDCTLRTTLHLLLKRSYTTLLAPGAGEPNIDTFAANPFESSKQRREAEVRSLLDKLSPEMISLDPTFVGSIDTDAAVLQKEQAALAAAANTREKPPVKAKNKMRGRSKIAKKLQKKQSNVVDAGVLKLREKRAAEREAAKSEQEESKKAKASEGAPSALAKFFA